MFNSCWVQLAALVTACEATAVALSTSSSSASGGSSSVGDSFNSAQGLTQRLHPQLCLVIAEMLALAPQPNILSAGLQALAIAVTSHVSVSTSLGLAGSHSTAATVAAFGAQSRLFQPLVWLVAPAYLHAAGGEFGTFEGAVNEEYLLSVVILFVIGARLGEHVKH